MSPTTGNCRHSCFRVVGVGVLRKGALKVLSVSPYANGSCCGLWGQTPAFSWQNALQMLQINMNKAAGTGTNKVTKQSGRDIGDGGAEGVLVLSINRR